MLQPLVVTSTGMVLARLEIVTAGPETKAAHLFRRCGPGERGRELEFHIVRVIMEFRAADRIVGMDGDESVSRHLRCRKASLVSERQRPVFTQLESVSGEADGALRRRGGELEIAIPEIQLSVGIAARDTGPAHGRVRQGPETGIVIGIESRFQIA